MPVSYLISVITSQKDVEVILAILNIAGKGHAFHGFSNGDISTDLWIIPKGKKNIQSVITELQTIPAIRSVTIVALSNPVKNSELLEVRKLFADVGWDASSVPDNTLSLFINAKLKGQYTCYIAYNHREKLPVKIEIKLIEEHPLFSPDWLKAADYTEDEIQSSDLTIDDIEIRSVVIETIQEIETPPPPSQNDTQ
jgi:hypothetical protein